MKLFFQTTIMGLITTLFGFVQTNEDNFEKLTEITLRTDTSEGFSDIFLTINTRKHKLNKYLY